MHNHWPVRLIITFVAIVLLLNRPTHSQERKFLTPPKQLVAVRAGNLFDSKSGNLLNNQIVLIRGERVADVGANFQIPREERVIDLSNATVLPGAIDTRVHVNTGGDTAAQRAFLAGANAQIDLAGGCPTVSHR